MPSLEPSNLVHGKRLTVTASCLSTPYSMISCGSPKQPGYTAADQISFRGTLRAIDAYPLAITHHTSLISDRDRLSTFFSFHPHVAQIMASCLPTLRRAFSTVNTSEIAHFSRLSAQWWDEHGEFTYLHKMNPVRMQFIRDKFIETARDQDVPVPSHGRILEGKDVLDVGCGGGLLSEVATLLI